MEDTLPENFLEHPFAFPLKTSPRNPHFSAEQSFVGALLLLLSLLLLPLLS